ncbi:hypothetical protein RF11_15089 [Thelohanellus kitauei]|uniref:Uncharacterized protein n=1 Tax=Thelohanellus kitauei TaxID=669202 RepID=A0A0C2MES4_THEKT|nr:hypothetical protein RF11_15089 [Thelohanellus kitauei]
MIFDINTNENDRFIRDINNPISIDLLNHFKMNSYEHYFWDTIFNSNKYNDPNKMIVDALKCLILMMASHNCMDSISKMNEYHKKLSSIMMKGYCSTSTDEIINKKATTIGV